MEKIPYIKFFPGDWLRDNVSGCSLAAQGLWLRMMILMHDSERYGYLTMNGLPIPPGFIARKCGCDTLEQYNALLDELDNAGIPSRTPEGAIYSRRMVKDARERQRKAGNKRDQRDRDSGQLKKNGDKPPHVTAPVTEPVTGSVTEMSSLYSDSGSDSDLNPPNPPSGGEEGGADGVEPRQRRKPKIDRPAHGDRPQSYAAFKACFALYPIKQAEDDAWTEWCRLEDNGTLAPQFEVRDAIIRHTDEDVYWKKNKAPLFWKWLKGKRWNDEPVTEPSAATQEGPPPVKSWSDADLAAIGIVGKTW
ncbi:hypothetical protein [Solidesulfovibrio sp.]